MTTERHNIRSQLAELKVQLALVSDDPSLDAQVLLAHVMGKNRAWVLAHPEAQLTPDEEDALHLGLDRLLNGEPLPYVIGHWEFFGLDFLVTPDVLIPRPETEMLVEESLEWLRVHRTKRTAADIGTGSGCLAVSLAFNVNRLRMVAGDISFPALELAQENSVRHGVREQITFYQGQLLTCLARPVDLLCANLPYIPSETLASLPVSKREPVVALQGGKDGLDIIRGLLKDAPRILALDGLLLIEIESGQGKAALKLARQAFPIADITLLPDLAGLDRVIRVENSG